jgi:hypothetical protein
LAAAARCRAIDSGIAPDVAFVGVKVLDGSGAGATSDVISAIEFLVTHPELACASSICRWAIRSSRRPAGSAVCAVECFSRWNHRRRGGQRWSGV